MAKARTRDHEIVSIYPFSDAEVDALMSHSAECVLMWATRDGWPVGVTHSFLWHDGCIWLTFASHRYGAAAIRRDNRVSVNVSSRAYPDGAPADLPQGAITFKGRGEFIEGDDEIREWFYRALAKKVRPDSKEGEEAFYNLLDSPLRTILKVTPVKSIMYNAGLAARHMEGDVDESELGERQSGDRERMNAERAKRGLPPR